MRIISSGSIEGRPICCKTASAIAKIIEVEMPVDAPEQVIGGDVIIEAEIVEQPSRRRLNAHHRRIPPPNQQELNESRHCSDDNQ